MSTEEQLKAFLEKVKSDISIQEKLKTFAAYILLKAFTEAAVEIAKEAGFCL